MNRIEKPYFKPRIASKIKIKLNNKLVKKYGLKNQIYFVMLLTLL